MTIKKVEITQDEIGTITGKITTDTDYVKMVCIPLTHLNPDNSHKWYEFIIITNKGTKVNVSKWTTLQDPTENLIFKMITQFYQYNEGVNTYE